MHYMDRGQESVLLLGFWRLWLVQWRKKDPHFHPLFGLYLDEISNYIEILGGSGVCLIRNPSNISVL